MFGRTKALERRISTLEYQVNTLAREITQVREMAKNARDAARFTTGGLGQETFTVGPVVKELLHHLKVYPYTISATPARLGIESTEV